MVCSAPLLARTNAARRTGSIGALVVMMLFTLVAAMSAGFLYLPADVALLVAVRWQPGAGAPLPQRGRVDAPRCGAGFGAGNIPEPARPLPR